MFQDYLDKYSDGEDARTLIVEFLELENDGDLRLNKNDQRIMFVANNYRKEVTSTVLWLINHDINIQCFKATPFKLGDGLFLQIDQIIPVPEIEEFMIDAKEKKQEEKTQGAVSAETDRLLVEFWKKLKNDLISHNVHYLDNVTPKAHFNYGFLKGKGRFAFVFGKHAPRVELYFHNDVGKVLFDSVKKYQAELENQFDGEITWERLDNKKASRIKYEMSLEEAKEIGKFKDTAYWDKRIEWFRESFVKFYNVVYPVWEKAQKDL